MGRRAAGTSESAEKPTRIRKATPFGCELPRVPRQCGIETTRPRSYPVQRSAANRPLWGTISSLKSEIRSSPTWNTRMATGNPFARSEAHFRLHTSDFESATKQPPPSRDPLLRQANAVEGPLIGTVPALVDAVQLLDQFVAPVEQHRAIDNPLAGLGHQRTITLADDPEAVSDSRAVRQHARFNTEPPGRLGRCVGGCRPTAWRAAQLDARLRARHRLLQRMDRARHPWALRAAGPQVRRGHGLPAGPGAWPGPRGARDRGDAAADRAPRRRGKLPQPGQPAASDYLGEGYVIVRDPDTDVVRDALQRIISGVRVELAEAQ